MNLLAQMIKTFAKAHIETTKELESGSTYFLQSRLAVMQKSLTFELFHKAFSIMNNIIDEVTRLEKQLGASDKERPMTTKLLKSYKERLTLTYLDLRLVYACNLNAV